MGSPDTGAREPQDSVSAAESAARMALSRLVLARASMRAALKNGDDSHLDAWLLAEQENGWVKEIEAALAAGVGESRPAEPPTDPDYIDHIRDANA